MEGGYHRAPADLTVFKSLGVAVEDLAAADLVYRTARRRRLGTWVDFAASHDSWTHEVS